MALLPPNSKLTFYKRVNVPLDSTRDRMFDLADYLMAPWRAPGRSKTAYLGIATRSRRWVSWNEANLKTIENLIRDDLNFDGYTVTIHRLGKQGVPCSKEFRWKLLIRE